MCSQIETNTTEPRNNTYQVVIVGTGFGGMCAAISLINKGIHDFVLLERRDFPGGTWCQNSYPGAAVDVQSPLYSISSEPYDWSRLFARQDELEAYTLHVFNKHGLAQKTRLNTLVTGMQWQQSSQQWIVETGEAVTYRARFVINASGPLSTPLIPEFKGKDRFKGKSFHTNEWDHEYDLRNKRVAIIGSGASAAQIIPAIAPAVKQLDIFQRSPHWVMPRMDLVWKPWQRKLLKIKGVQRVLRTLIYWALESRVIGFKHSRTLLNQVGHRLAKQHIRKQIADPVLRQKVTPDFALGCKRVILSNQLYPAYQRPNVQLHTAGDGIKEITETGIVTETGKHIEVDLIIYSTGYDATDGLLPYPITGNSGRTIAEFWSEYPRAYLGTSVPGFPNLFLVVGPNTGIGHTSAIFVIEAQMQYIMKSIIAVENNQFSQSIEVTADAEAAYTGMIHQEMLKTVWKNGGCRSWYQSKSGHVVAIFPGFSFTFRRWAARLREQDHVFS